MCPHIASHTSGCNERFTDDFTETVERPYLVLDEGVHSLQHPLTGELVGQVGLNLMTQTQTVRTYRESTAAGGGEQAGWCVDPI